MLVCAPFWFIRPWGADGGVEDGVGDIVCCRRSKAAELVV